ncbi:MULTISPECIES: MoaD/ThiS family protein [Acinetobacter]|uniref:MoaD/ThiS family protein n=1 Tax=Acinetobacter TaxID=469 RepID=UPI000E34E9D6|nr:MULTISPECIES: MoaD/ThiS family protein [Acinetobacter]RFS26123.1 MoaD/ThiS family protein [Acinetobacter sp. SWAC5]RKG39954.1 MoaD/ThiS family protein [Acinetobacter cumulans]RZG56429.1 MoaD/ThiS family protein [Acinetobacter sp. WCHAc060006]
MTTIEIKIESFGAIERLIPYQFSLNCEPEILIGDVFAELAVLFPKSQLLLDQCACAIGENIVPRHYTIEHSTTLVLLSPVAGG